VRPSVDPLDDTAATGRRIGAYRLTSLLGAGGMGEVWRARDEVLRRDVALKLLPPARQSPDARRRMLDEARAQAALAHPNVCVVHGAGEDEHGVWIAMELLDGPNLVQAMRRSPEHDVRRALRWATQIAAALEAAHARGLVHRDLKPANVMLHGDGLKLVDFGLAKRVERATASADAVVTSEGMIVGTPRYMSPEQARGDELTTASDVFSFGIVLHELLSGRAPFAGETPFEVMTAIMTERPASLDVPGVAPELASLVDECLAKDAAQRPRASDVHRRLRDLVEVAPPSRARSPRRRARVVLASAAVIALAAAGVVTARVVGGGDADPAPAPPSAPPRAAPVEQLLGDFGPLMSVAFDRGGRNLVFVAQDGRLMRVRDGVTVPVPDASRATWTACCAGDRIVVIGEHAHLLYAETLALEPAPRMERLVGALARFAPNGRDVVRVQGNQHLQITNLDDQRGAWTVLADAGTDHRILSMVWSPTGERVAYLEMFYRGPVRYIAVNVVRVDDGSITTIAEFPWRADHAPAIGWHRGVWFTEQIRGDSIVTELQLDERSRVVARRELHRWKQRAAIAIAVSDRYLAFADARSEDHAVWTTLAPGNKTLELAVVPGAFVPAGWLRDGRLLAGTKGAAGVPQVTLHALDGTHAVAWSEAAKGGALPVDRTDDTLVYRVGAELWASDLDGRHRRKLRDDADTSTVACASAGCVVYQPEGNAWRVRDLDLATGAAGKTAWFETGAWTAVRELRMSVSRDGSRIAIPHETSVDIVTRPGGARETIAIEDTDVVDGVAFWGDGLIVTGSRHDHASILRVAYDGQTDTLLSGDHDWYGLPFVDEPRDHLAFAHSAFHDQLKLVELPQR
jgi:hypothetical protein